MAAVLVREEDKTQRPVYFISKTLQGAKTRYTKLEKLAYALLISSRRLKQYFQRHTIILKTDQAIRQVLQKPELTGRMMAWVVELSQYDLQYEQRQAIKAQAMTDFLVEVTGEAPDLPNTRWKLHVDGASNQTFGGAGIILENSAGVAFEQSIKFEFPVSNNQAKYEGLIGGLMLAKEVGASRLEISSDSQVVTSQVNGSYQVVTIQHVPREKNARADLLSKLASTKPGTGNRSLIQGLATEPAIIMCATQAPNPPSWMDPISRYLKHAQAPPNQKEAEFIKRKAPKYTIIQGQLYKRGLHQPLLKCLRPDQTDYVLREVHEGCCGHHIVGRSLARKIIRAGYYWPTMMSDAQEFVKKCKKCQENADFHKAPSEELNLMMAPRPFAQWGIDLLGPFSPGPGQVKYLIVAIDYYTKWVEAEPLASISAANCQKFMWKQVVTRFGIPETVISDNGTQFTDKKFKGFLEGLGIKQRFSSVEHPQTNGQVEAANKVILKGLKKRLEGKKGSWAEEIAPVLWSYRTTPSHLPGNPPSDSHTGSTLSSQSRSENQVRGCSSEGGARQLKKT
ncbi:uncharacterized protein LOC130948405 [Arachis stenosperma]|uniref:uncharacterized protein LOC130948405 n=1 Tax=Arachis stenosperma TaxID=217475 RepID=UPI0025ABBBF6|nr:uncharacterized protein LOC130948405 [Arachis stenosperma]